MDISQWTTCESVRDSFKDRSVLFIDDSLVRGLYKDLACILSGYDRTLNLNELKFNRHQQKKMNYSVKKILSLMLIEQTTYTIWKKGCCIVVN